MSKEVVKFIRKSNDLVEARYKFDIWETRIFTKMLTMIRRSDEDFKDYKIYLKDIVNDFDLEKNKEAYEFLREGARKLMKKSFYIPYEVEGVKRLFEAPVVSSLDSAVMDGRRLGDEHLYLKVSFHPKMKPYLLQLKSQFTMYDVRNILKLPSAYSIRLYELLKQYEKIGQRTFVVMELKEILGIEDKYKMYGHFKKRVLQKSQKDLKKFTDICFDFEEIKRGRAVYKVKFLIKRNSPDFVKLEQPKEEKPSIQVSAEYDLATFEILWKQVEGHDVTKATLKKWMVRYKDNPNHVGIGIQYVMDKIEAGEQILTVGGYINRILQEEEIANPKAIKLQQFNKQKKAVEEAENRRRALEKKQKALEQDRHLKEVAIIDEILVEIPDAKDIALEKVKAGIFASYYNPAKSIEENFSSQIFLSAFRNAIKKEFAPMFIEIDQAYRLKIAKIKNELRK